MRRALPSCVLLAAFASSLLAQSEHLPLKDGSLRFAVIGDAGTGGSRQLEVAKQLAIHRDRFPFELTIMLGDNLYGRERPRDHEAKFELGSSAKLRRGDIEESELTAKGYDQGYTFLLAEIAGDELFFHTISHEGKTVDGGVIHRP